MKKLIMASALLALSAFPVLAQSDDPYYGPERREQHAQDDEILSNCVNTNRNLYCAETDDGAGIWQINDEGFYHNCRFFGCFQVGNERFIRSENGELIQVNPGNE